MTALREVANVAARTAIARHGRRQLLRLSSAKLPVMMLAAVCGAAMIGMCWFFRASEVTFYGGLVILFVALVWGAQYAILTGRLLVGKSRRPQWHSQEQTQPAENDQGPPGASTESEIRNPS
jgi:hypothetical protein